MKVLWLVNVKLPIVYKAQGEVNKTYVGGWLDQISEKFIKENNLVVIYPSPNVAGEKGKNDHLSYYGIYFNPIKMNAGNLNGEEYISKMEKILLDERPDVIHVHGTEFQHSFFLTEAAKNVGMDNRVVVSIQGMVAPYAEHYLFQIPLLVKYGKTVKGFIKRESVYSGYKAYIRRGESESKTLQNVHYVIGRTNWDKGCVNLVNPKANYLFCNETLRKNFYDKEWEVDNCVRHSIFVSQASYPIKGFHLLLNAANIVKQRFPDLIINVAGADLSKDNFIKGSTYALYIQKLLKKYGLTKNVRFLGPQNAEAMKAQMLSTNVFVSPSTIENSPNSLGEAMILGLPCISSDVGGVSDLMIHNKEGYVYPLDESYMLAYYVMDLFANDKKATEFGKSARLHARKTHDVDVNFKTLVNIYKQIFEESK